ncbi:hypothetical protein FRC12_019072 [Ceratobasidium sp. 428]|nr:hypothetical protein FRC12_019072 [Ceratobasidium sp. 428]
MFHQLTRREEWQDEASAAIISKLAPLARLAIDSFICFFIKHEANFFGGPEAEFQDIEAKTRASLLQELFFAPYDVISLLIVTMRLPAELLGVQVALLVMSG